MNSRFSFALTVALLVVGSLVAGIVLVPGDSEMALIHLRGKQYKTALAEYERLGREGELSTGVVKSLCDLYLQRGEVDRAVLLLEHFVEVNPNDLGARRRLGVLYQYAQRPADFRINLEKIQRLDSDEETLRKLSRIYNANADCSRQIGILQLLISEHEGSAQDYLDLAYLEAREGRYSDAVAVMRRVQELFPEAITEQSREVLINLLLDAGYKPEAKREAEEWLAERRDWRMASKLGALFASRLQPKLALALLKPFRAMAGSEPRLMGQIVEMMIASGQRDDAFKLLESMHDANSLPATCVAPLVDLALSKSRITLAVSVATHGAAFTQLPEWLKEGVVEAVRNENQAPAARRLLGVLPRGWLEAHVLDSIRLALVARDYQVASHWVGMARRQGLDPGDEYFYEVSRARKRGAAVAALLAEELRWRLAEGQLSPELKGDLLTQLVELGFAEETLGGLAELARARPEDWFPYFVQVADSIHAAGAVVEVSCELLQSESLTERQTENVFYVLFDHGAFPDRVLPQLKAFALRRGGSWASAYEERLLERGMREQLATFWSTRAALTDTSPEERRSIAFKLLEAGQQDRAVAVFQRLARAAVRPSQDLDDLLSLWGEDPPEEAREWLLERALAARDDELEHWISQLLMIGMTREAIEIAGVRLPPAGEGRALRALYLEALRAEGEKEKLLRLIGEELSFEMSPERLGELGEAALEAGDMALADHAFQLQLAAEPRSVEARRQLGRLAFAASRYSLAKEYLAEVIAEDEGDFESRFFYGEILLREGDRPGATSHYRRALAQLGEFAGRESRQQVIRAQLLHRLGRTRAARHIFDGLLRDDPGQNQLRADYVSLLLDEGDLPHAGSVLAGAPPGGSVAGRLRLDLLTAALATREGRTGVAAELLAELHESWPEDPTVLVALASNEEVIGRWGLAQRHAERALSLGPANEDIYRAREALLLRRRPHAELALRQETGDADTSLQVASVRFESPLAFSLRAGLVHQQARATLSETSTVERGRMDELFLQRDSGNGTQYGVSVFAGDEGSGVGAILRRHDLLGVWDASLRLNEPYWDLAAAVDAGATRSQLSLARRQHFSRGIEARALASLNRYGCRDCIETIDSLRLTFDLVYPLRRGRIAVAGHYLLDAEYMSSAPAAADLLFRRREVHTPAFSVRGSLAKRVPAAVILGYSWDRFGGQGINLGAELGYEIDEGLRMQLSFGQQLGRSGAEGVVRHFSAGLVWTL